RGSILKVLFDDEYVIEETYVTEEAKPVPLMKLSETLQSLYLAFDDQVIQVPMQYCERHTNCYSCVTARDPHCSWDTESSTCVTGGDDKGKFLQNVSYTGGSGCGCQDVSRIVTTTTVTGNEGMAVILPFKLPVDVMVKKENNDVNIDNAKYILVIGVGLVITNLELSDSATYNFTAKADGTLLASFYLIVKTNKCIENVVSCQNRKVFLFCCAHTESNFTWSPIVDGSPLTETHTECNNKISWLSIIVTPDTNTTYTCKITPLDGSSTKNYEATVTLQ
uniref:Semaphorin-4G-like n=1 Tax=Saccoglossus kowalevskii TaxID=10224 RepID=A0ABM0M8H1_SACKO